MSANPTAVACPEHWQLFELVTEGSTELNAHVKQHVETGCTACGKRLGDIQTIERARVMKDEFDAFFDELPSDDAPAEEREKFLSQFKRTSRPVDRLGRLSFDGRQIAAEIVKLAGEKGIEAAKSRIDAIETDPSRGYALLYASQLAMPKVSSDPALFVELAKAIATASRSLPFLKDKGPAQPVCREQVMGEAQLLESNALNFQGRHSEAIEVARVARTSFIAAAEDSFALALADYFEGAAAMYTERFRGAWRLLRHAKSEFELYGQENWQGRVEASLGNLVMWRNRCAAAVNFFDSALTLLHPELDASAYTATLVNRGYALARIGRLDAAKVTYARALMMARRSGLTIYILTIRVGLARIEIEKGNVWKALRAFEKLAEDAESAGAEEHVFSARLRAAQCLVRLGKADTAGVQLAAARRSSFAESMANEPDFRALFESTPEAGLIAHIADYFDARDRGVRSDYRPFKLVANGN